MHKKKGIAILTLCLLLTQCTTWYRLTRKDSKLWNESDIKILTSVAETIEFRPGFDPYLDLDYIYMAGNFTKEEIAIKEKKLKEALSPFKSDEVIDFYEKVLYALEVLRWYAEDYKKDEKWHEVTYIEKYLLPDTQKFSEMLEKNILLLFPDYGKVIKEKKEAIKSRVIKELD